MSRERKVPRRRFREFQNGKAWKQIKIGEAGSFYYGHSCPKWSVTEDATIPCIRYGELYTKFGTKIDRVFSYTNISPDKLRFSKGTEVLIPRVGEDPMDYNHCTWLSMPGVAIGEMISVYNTEQNPLFTATMFNATLQEEFAVRVEGGSVTNLYFEKLKNIDVCFPSIAEQEKIAGFIEKIDNIINLNQHKLKKLKALKKAYLTQMFPSAGECKPKLRFAGFNDEWEQRKLGDEVIEVVAGGDVDKGKIRNYGKYPVLANSLVNNGIVGYYNNYFRVKAPAVTVTGRGDVGHARARKVNFTPVVRLISIKSKHNVDFLEHAINNCNVINESTGVPQLTVPQLSNYNIYFPKTIDEEEAIGEFFYKLEDIIKSHQRKLQKLQNLKKAYLNEMFI